MLPDNVTDILAGACPVVASFGGKDKGLRGVADDLRRAASKAGVPADVKEYPSKTQGPFPGRRTPQVMVTRP